MIYSRFYIFPLFSIILTAVLLQTVFYIGTLHAQEGTKSATLGGFSSQYSFQPCSLNPVSATSSAFYYKSFRWWGVYGFVPAIFFFEDNPKTELQNQFHSCMKQCREILKVIEKYERDENIPLPRNIVFPAGLFLRKNLLAEIPLCPNWDEMTYDYIEDPENLGSGILFCRVHGSSGRPNTAFLGVDFNRNSPKVQALVPEKVKKWNKIVDNFEPMLNLFLFFWGLFLDYVLFVKIPLFFFNLKKRGNVR